MRKYAAWYSIILGGGMLWMWVFFFVSGSVPEARTAPVALAFHLAAEGLTAGLLILSGVLLLKGVAAARWLLPLALGMLAYSAIVSPGYFAQRGEWGFVAMFAVFLLAGIPALLVAVKDSASASQP